MLKEKQTPLMALEIAHPWAIIGGHVCLLMRIRRGGRPVLSVLVFDHDYIAVVACWAYQQGPLKDFAKRLSAQI